MHFVHPIPQTPPPPFLFNAPREKIKNSANTVYLSIPPDAAPTLTRYHGGNSMVIIGHPAHPVNGVIPYSLLRTRWGINAWLTLVFPEMVDGIRYVRCDFGAICFVIDRHDVGRMVPVSVIGDEGY